MIQRNTLPFNALLDIARQRNGFDEPRCRLVLEFLSAAAAMHATLQRGLNEFSLTDLKLGVLIVLFVTDPSPATPADLATHTGATRSAMTDLLDQLEARALVHRERGIQDRRLIHVQLTDAGRKLTDIALTRYLQRTGDLARNIQPLIQKQLLSACTQLHEDLQSPHQA